MMIGSQTKNWILVFLGCVPNASSIISDVLELFLDSTLVEEFLDWSSKYVVSVIILWHPTSTLDWVENFVIMVEFGVVLFPFLVVFRFVLR